MTYFITKVWGFSPPAGPLQFGTEGWRKRAIQLLKDGDRVLYVGTKGAPTDEKDRGRVLGMVESTKKPVMSLDFYKPRAETDYDDEGHYRWPFALHIRHAWEFLEPRPLLESITPRQFAMDAAAGIVALTKAQALQIGALPVQEVDRLQPLAPAQARLGEEAPRKRGAPPPSFSRRSVMHMRREPAFTYALEIEGAKQECFKIGWAFDIGKRRRQFNSASLPQLGGFRYKARLDQLWDTAREAYRMEQAVLTFFDRWRHAGNREVICSISFSQLESAWVEQMLKVRFGKA